MLRRQSGIAKLIVVIVLAIMVGIAFMLMTQEQKARSAAEAVNETLGEVISGPNGSLTPEQVHEKIGRQPHTTRIPGDHKFVEEYHWKGPMSQYTVYAYYSTAATKLLEAVSINQKIDDWEEETK